MVSPPADASAGYERRAHEYIAHRSAIGAQAVRDWAQSLPRGAAVLDIGCGHGVPVSAVLLEEGLDVYGVDASPTLVDAFRTRFPGVPVECSTIEDAALFGRTFDAVVAWGLVFLLTDAAQRQLLDRVSSLLNPGGSFLFTAPAEACEWQDVLTGVTSRSLGAEAYRRLARAAGLETVREGEDEGGNHYYVVCRPADTTHR